MIYETNRTRQRSLEEWTEVFNEWIQDLHCSLVGESMACSEPDEQLSAARWFADKVMKADACGHI